MHYHTIEEDLLEVNDGLNLFVSLLLVCSNKTDEYNIAFFGKKYVVVIS